MIHKVALIPGEILRVGGLPIHVDTQQGLWQIWYVAGGGGLYDVTVVGTGPGHYDITGWDHINTFMEHGGMLVWHAFRSNKA